MLLYIAFIILLLVVFFKILKLCIKAAWGLTKILVRLVLFPISLIAMAFGGLVWIAIAILVIVGILVFAK